jgi:micrococcal nuclease
VITCHANSEKVKRIIDGDTFEIVGGEKVRLIGINAPEIRDIYGEEAKQYLDRLIEEKNIDLRTDGYAKDRDRYSRLLRYVYLNETDINKQMILDGYAFAYLKYHFDKEDEYKGAQIFATSNKNGMWGNDAKKKNTTEIKKEQHETNSFQSKKYLLGGMILVLIILGIYYYFKK